MSRALAAVTRPIFVVLVISLMAAIVGLLAYGAGTLGSQTNVNHLNATPALVTAIPPLPGTPVARYARLDPAIVAYLESGQPEYGRIPLEIIGAELPPIGAFLPRTGNTRFNLPPASTPATTTAASAALPTLPYPTSPPLPTIIIPTVPPGTPTPDLVATVQAFAETVPYGPYPYALENCAPSGMPTEGILTQYYYGSHSGIDLGIPLGTPIQTTHSGIVSWAEWNTYGYGNLVIIQSGTFITYYAHLTSPNVMAGEVVSKGAIIGWSGSTGNSSGPHLHYETRINDVPVDPLTFESRGYGTC